MAQSWWTDLTEDTIRGGLYLKSDQCYFHVDYKNDSISEFYDYYLLTICTLSVYTSCIEFDRKNKSNIYWKWWSYYVLYVPTNGGYKHKLKRPIGWPTMGLVWVAFRALEQCWRKFVCSSKRGKALKRFIFSRWIRMNRWDERIVTQPFIPVRSSSSSSCLVFLFFRFRKSKGALLPVDFHFVIVGFFVMCWRKEKEKKKKDIGFGIVQSSMTQ